MKVFILALDGLDYRLVEKWNLKNLLQRTHGTYSVSEFNQVKNLSVSVWASFITGRYHRFANWWDKKWLIRIADKIPISDTWKWRFAKLLGASILDKRALKAPSMFDIIPNSIAVNVPVYNEKTEYHVKKLDALHFRGVDAYIDTIVMNHLSRYDDVCEALNGNGEWNLFMAWFDIADALGHLLMGKKDEMHGIYESLNYMTARMKDKVDKRTIFLIVSDHGMEWQEGFGEHTKTAFWSLNIETDWKPKRVVDFFPKILEWVKE